MSLSVLIFFHTASSTLRKEDSKDLPKCAFVGEAIDNDSFISWPHYKHVIINFLSNLLFFNEKFGTLGHSSQFMGQ